MSSSVASIVAIDTAVGAAVAVAVGAGAGAAGAAGALGLAAFTFASDTRALCPRILLINDPNTLIDFPPSEMRDQTRARPTAARSSPRHSARVVPDSSSARFTRRVLFVSALARITTPNRSPT